MVVPSSSRRANANYHLSEQILTRMGKQIIDAKAEEAAIELATTPPLNIPEERLRACPRRLRQRPGRRGIVIEIIELMDYSGPEAYEEG